MLLLALILGLVLGWCTGGRLTRFEAAGLRLLSLPIAALALQSLVHTPWALALSYAVLLFFLWQNRAKRKTALFMTAGSLCNLLVIACNGWRMPVSSRALSLLSEAGRQSLLSGSIPMYVSAGPDTKLLFLGDILYCPIPLLRGFASVGDLLLAAGVFFCLMSVMQPTRMPRWLKSG